MPLEEDFDPIFTARLALREKQIQQNYRPVIGIHKWFARRPGSVFRSLLLAEFGSPDVPTSTSYWQSHLLTGVVADPFMGGGTPVYEATRLGFSTVAADTNPMAYWIVRQSLTRLDIKAFRWAAEQVICDVDSQLVDLYRTECCLCGREAVVKYFLWVKTANCPQCGRENKLFPGYLLAEPVRHPRYVVACGKCGALSEFETAPTALANQPCQSCGEAVQIEGPVNRQSVNCGHCGHNYPYSKHLTHPPRHDLWAIEYHCATCKPHHQGRFFKAPDDFDIARIGRARALLGDRQGLPIPQDAIPRGDETDRLHRWGYTHYYQMFNDRQLLGLGILLKRINEVGHDAVRHALLTVFSDFLRYQNMLCRYDTYALKCQDIFSVHGFPVGLVQCENNLLGIPKIGSGSFRHFIEKFVRAKEYCQQPFEVLDSARGKRQVFTRGETIEADLVDHFPSRDVKQSYLRAASSTTVTLQPESLDGVFTDPPYYDNVQYAELMDFCYVWLRLGLSNDIDEFSSTSTRNQNEATGNQTLGRGIDEFTTLLSSVYQNYAKALKPNAPFVFTYHHNDPEAYAAVVVAILDAGLVCTDVLPAPAEMGASLHIANTNSSTLDSVFVCRASMESVSKLSGGESLRRDVTAMVRAGVKTTKGDVKCLRAGHLARIAISNLRSGWCGTLAVAEKLSSARTALAWASAEFSVDAALSIMADSKGVLSHALL